MNQLAAICSLFVVVSALTNESELVCGVHDVNQYVDDFMEKVRANIDEKVDLPDERNIITMYNGQFFGLESVNRTGPASITCTDKAITVTFPFKTEKPIRIRYDWEAQILTRRIKGIYYARAGVFEAEVKVDVPRNSQGPARITNINIVDFKDIEINVSGLAHISWLWSKSMTMMANLFNVATSYIAREKLRDVMNRQLANINLYNY